VLRVVEKECVMKPVLRVLTIAVLGLAFVVGSTKTVAGQAKSSSDLLTARQVADLIANAKTPSDHMKLSRHYAALAKKYDAEVADHEIVAKAYRSSPNASESKRPGAPDTAVHCDRLADDARAAAKEARELAAAHEHMATAK
jgi:hypothetical protein